MDHERLISSIRRRGAAPFYLIHGDDAAAKEKLVRLLQAELCEPDLREWCVVTVDGGERTGGEVAELASTPPFLGERRVVIVRDAETLVDDESLIAYVEHPAAFSTLILVYNTLDKRRKLYQEAKKRGQEIECQAPTGERLADHIRRMCVDAGIEIDPEAASVLLERAGDDPIRIEREIEKLATYAGDGGRIRREDAEALVSRGAPALGPYAIFDFLDAIADGRGAQALEHLGRLLAAGEHPLLILAMIARQLRLIVGAKGWQGERPEDVAQALELKSTFPAKKALAQAGRWSADRLAWALGACVQTDQAMKNGIDGRLALELLTLKLTAGGGRGEGAKKSRGRYGPRLP